MDFPGPFSMLMNSPVLLDMPWIQLFFTTFECVGPWASDSIGYCQLSYISEHWARVAEERPDEEQALFLRDVLIIEMLENNPVRSEYFRGMRMRLQVAYAILEMEALATGFIGCENCTCC